MAVYDFFLSRNNGVSGSSYIGHAGRLFYDSADGLFRLSDGATPGGRIVANLSIATSQASPPPMPRVGELWFNPTNNELLAYYNGNWQGTINVATESTLGGVKLGPGVLTNSEGQIIIDSTGLEFSFGDFQATTGPGSDSSTAAYLSSIYPNEDIVIESNGTGTINIVGKFNIYPPDGDISGRSPVFSIDELGDISAATLDIQNPNDLGFMAPLNVTINEAGLTKTPTVVTGSVAQFTGRDARTSILVVDTYGIDPSNSKTGGEFVFRTGRGTNASTTAVQSGDRLGSFTAAGWASNGYGGVGVGGLRILANENYTSTARGSKIELFVTANGTITPTTIATVSSTGINVTGTVVATTGTFTNFSGKFVRTVRNAGTIGAGGTLTIDFTTDSLVYCTWGDGMTINYQNYLAGSVVKVLATKATGTGVDTLSLDGITAAQTSSGSTTVNANPDTTVFIEFTCVGTTLGSVYAKL